MDSDWIAVGVMVTTLAVLVVGADRVRGWLVGAVRWVGKCLQRATNPFRAWCARSAVRRLVVRSLSNCEKAGRRSGFGAWHEASRGWVAAGNSVRKYVLESPWLEVSIDQRNVFGQPTHVTGRYAPLWDWSLWEHIGRYERFLDRVAVIRSIGTVDSTMLACAHRWWRFRHWKAVRKGKRL